MKAKRQLKLTNKIEDRHQRQKLSLTLHINEKISENTVGYDSQRPICNLNDLGFDSKEPSDKK